ncbi:MAG: peptidoglycan-binding domain-containing protein [bacterium]|nr:peptidoglycan-binding domain-containing protein [bacterium]
MKNLYRSGLLLVGLLMLVTAPLSAGAQYTQAPTCVIHAEKSSYRYEDSIILYWSSQNATYGTFQQDTSGKDTLWLPGDKLAVAGSQTIKANVTGNPVVTLLIYGAGGSGSCSTTFLIEDTASTPVISISAYPHAIGIGQNSTLSWNATNAQRCVLSYDFSQESVSLVGSKVVSPLQTTMYTLWCANDPGTGKDGPSATQSATVYVSAKSPSCSITTDKTSYKLGEKIVLTWKGDNATYASFVQDASGKDTLWLPGDKLKAEDSYAATASVTGNPKITLSVYNAIGSATCSVTAFIFSEKPSASSNANVSAPATAQTTKTSCVSLLKNLRYRSRDVQTSGEVSSLQAYLQVRGYLDSEPTGFFGSLTLEAVKKFQSANLGADNATGFVGALTRAKIKALSCL